jgi:hypothetical protein
MTPATGVAERETAVDMILSILDKKREKWPFHGDMALRFQQNKTDYQRTLKTKSTTIFMLKNRSEDR